MPKPDEFAPCELIDNDDGSHQLIFTDFDPTASIFEEQGQDGGGYGWHGVVDALVRMRIPKLRKKVQYDPEASMFVAYGKDRDVLKQVAGLIREAVANTELLKEAIRKADPDLMG